VDDKKRKEMLEKVKGPVVPVNIPFTKEEKVDYNALERYIDFLASSSVPVLLMTYGSSEYGSLCDEEIYEITRVIGSANAKRSHFVGASKCWQVEKSVDYIEFARKCGADAVKVQPDMWTVEYNQNTVFEYYKRICERTDFPLWAYTAPANGKPGLSPETIHRISSELTNFYAMKTDAEMMYSYFNLIHAARDFMVVSGGQMKTMLYGYRMGSKAYLCTIAPFIPEAANKFYSLIEQNEHDSAYAMVKKWEMPMLDLCSKFSWLSIIKAAIHIVGYFPSWTVRLPGGASPVKECDLHIIKKVVDGLIKAANEKEWY